MIYTNLFVNITKKSALLMQIGAILTSYHLVTITEVIVWSFSFLVFSYLVPFSAWSLSLYCTCILLVLSLSPFYSAWSP